MVIVHSQTMLFVLFIEPNISNSFFVKCPATAIDHERDQEKVDG